MSRLLLMHLIFTVIQFTTSCEEEEQPVATEDLLISTEEATVAIGKEIDIYATVSPYGSGNEVITWTSSNPNIASVEEKELTDGKSNATIKGIGLGEAVITVASATDETKKASIRVTVSESTFKEMAMGFDYSSDDLITYSVPDRYSQEGDPLFNVSINGKYTGVYTDINGWKKLVSFSYFDFTPGKEVEVVVTYSKPFANYEILPKSLNISSTKEGNSIRFKLSEANQKLSIVFDNNYQGNTFHLFANAIDINAPTQSSDNLIYLGPGYHDLQAEFGGSLDTNGKDIYIAGGAVANGRLVINSNGNTVSGHGIFMKSTTGNLVVLVNYAQNTVLKDFITCSHRDGGWTIGTHEASGVTFQDVKVVSPRYASTDGFDIVNSNDIHLKDVFIRSCDDAIAIKGLIDGIPANCPPCENMTFENLQIWNDCNNAMGLGAETRAKYYKDIHFKNIDVIFSYDDISHHDELDERSVMNICCLEGTCFKNITWEDIRVNRCERLACITFKDNFWFGSLLGDQSTEGGVDGITYKNISVESNSGSSIANEILLHGWYKNGTPTKVIQNITFDNVVIEGKHVSDKNDKHIKTNNTSEVELVNGLIFR